MKIVCNVGCYVGTKQLDELYREANSAISRSANESKRTFVKRYLESRLVKTLNDMLSKSYNSWHVGQKKSTPVTEDQFRGTITREPRLDLSDEPPCNGSSS
jgi:hypothetical protein